MIWHWHATYCRVSLLQSLNTSCNFRSLVSGSTPHERYSSSRSVSVKFHFKPAARLLRSQSNALHHPIPSAEAHFMQTTRKLATPGSQVTVVTQPSAHSHSLKEVIITGTFERLVMLIHNQPQMHTQAALLQIQHSNTLSRDKTLAWPLPGCLIKLPAAPPHASKAAAGCECCLR